VVATELSLEFGCPSNLTYLFNNIILITKCIYTKFYTHKMQEIYTYNNNNVYKCPVKCLMNVRSSNTFIS